jgi:hypothetical protein
VIEDVFIGIILAVLGLVAVVVYLAVALPRARARRELARKKGELASESELDEFIRKVDQVIAADELDHLEDEGEDT